MAEVVLSEKKPLSRSEREASIKDKAGWLITVLAALRNLAGASWQYEVLEVIRGRKPAHQRERQLIAEFEPSLNTF